MNNNMVLNRVFSQNSLNMFLKNDYPPCYMEAVSRYIEESSGKDNKELLSEIYVKLQDSYRNEYFYKNTLLNYLLVNNPSHNIYNSSVLSEIPIANSIADFIFINGKAVVYEVKTELDNFGKLLSQISNYYKAFKQVTVITSEENLPKLKNVLTDYKSVGVFILTSDNKIESKRKPKDFSDYLDKTVMFKILRKKEYEALFLNLGLPLPKVNDFEYFDVCLDIFRNIQTELVYGQFLKILKKRCIIHKEKFLVVPQELRSMVYFSKMKEKDFEKLNFFLFDDYRRSDVLSLL